METFDWINYLRYDTDRVYAEEYRERVALEEDLYVSSLTLRAIGKPYRDLWAAAGEIGLVATVQQGQRLTIFGQVRHVEAFAIFHRGFTPLIRREERDQIILATIRAIPSSLHPTVAAYRDSRIPFVKIAHRVAGEFPVLRDWEVKDRVVLLSSGGMILGGLDTSKTS